jgi:hypothetical protein
MGYSTFYIGMLGRYSRSSDVAPTNSKLWKPFWHYGTCAWWAADELDEEELTEAIDSLDGDPTAILIEYRKLIESANRRYPKIHYAYVEKTHDVHQLLLGHQLRKRAFRMQKPWPTSPSTAVSQSKRWATSASSRSLRCEPSARPCAE